MGVSGRIVLRVVSHDKSRLTIRSGLINCQSIGIAIYDRDSATESRVEQALVNQFFEGAEFYVVVFVVLPLDRSKSSHGLNPSRLIPCAHGGFPANRGRPCQNDCYEQ